MQSQIQILYHFSTNLTIAEEGTLDLLAFLSHQPRFTKLCEMTGADKAMNPTTFAE